MPSIETIAGSLHDIGHPNEDHDKRAVEKMFMNAMLGKWPAVADTYANRKAALVATIIHTGDTVLHLAVSSRVEFNVTLLMGNIPEERFEEILGMGNDRGDTPLHLAAALGMKKTCSDMATRCPKLVTQARDEHGETPLFKAARHGQKEAFGAMRHAAPDARSTCDLHFCRKFGGDTILHVALLGEHYDLALEIIRCYPCLVEWANEKGVLPIHILASKPFAFESETSFFSLFKKRIYQWYRFRQRTIPNERDPEKREDERGQANQLDSETRNFPNVGRRRFQRNCDAPFNHFRSIMRSLLLLFGITGLWTTAIEAKKQRKIHVCARQIMIELLKDHREWDFGSAGRNPDKKRSDWLRLSRFSPEAVEVRRVATGFPTEESKGPSEEKQLAPSNGGPVGDWPESPILLAAKNGIKELVEYVLDHFPQALFDLDSNGKNIILLAAEHRQSNIYELMLKRDEMKQSVFTIVDKEGNSAAHLSAKLGPNQPRITRGAALRMHWEVNWFKYAERSVDPEFFPRYNNKGETAREIFMETHKDLLEESVSWLTETSKSWSVVAVLIVPMAFAAMTSLPTWGLGRNSSSLDERHGVIGSSFLTLCLSLLSFFRFLSFPGCRYEQWDFETDLPIKLKALLFYLYLSVSMNAITLSARYSLLGKEAGYLPYFIAFMHAPAYLLSVPLLELQFGGVPRRALPAPGKRYVR